MSAGWLNTRTAETAPTNANKLMGTSQFEIWLGAFLICKNTSLGTAKILSNRAGNDMVGCAVASAGLMGSGGGRTIRNEVKRPQNWRNATGRKKGKRWPGTTP